MQDMSKATFAAGCFWGVEDLFRAIPGVTSVISGYTGGDKENPTYEEVCTGTTGHAEAVEIEFDPAKVSYTKLLEVFFMNHDPTSRNRQGPDIGHQYRSAIFTHSDEQKTEAEAILKRAQGNFKNPIVTEILPAKPFWKAEEYHQKYLEKHGLGSCHI